MPRQQGATGARTSANSGDAVTSYRSPAKRKNIPPAGLEAQGVLKDAPKIRYEYNPHLPPVLRSAPEATEADKLPELLATARKRALSADEAKQLADALRRHEPWLEWGGKREKPWFEIEPVALHMHERISTQAILRVLAREDVERDLFADPQHDYSRAVQFYQHDVDWANRMILGDSLQVMASLARREDLTGKVQMIYLDPPYGIKFASNFQPQLGQRDVKDREQDLTREPEMVKAYRDTWTLGIHSYLAYLRDRLQMARELLADSGSIFVQISDENLHRVRCVMDEVFGAGNFVAIISFQKTGSMAGNLLPTTVDFLLWYARDIEKVKYKQVYQERRGGSTSLDRYDQILEPTGIMRRITDDEEATEDLGGLRRFQLTSLFSDGASTKPQAFNFRGSKYEPKGNAHWKTDVDDGLRRLALAERIHPQGDRLRYLRLAADFNLVPLADRWESVQIGKEALYVVQTSTTVIERCLMMTSDPGDLVLDPTCGSGTTAYVAEQWGRRQRVVNAGGGRDP
jgi:adenine-specific DNA-methyltransferase